MTSLPAKRKAAVKTEPSDRMEGRYGGMVGKQVKEEDSYGTEDMDTGMDGKEWKSVANVRASEPNVSAMRGRRARHEQNMRGMNNPQHKC